MKNWQAAIIILLIGGLMVAFALLMTEISNNHDALVRQQTVQEVCR